MAAFSTSLLRQFRSGLYYITPYDELVGLFEKVKYEKT